MFIEILNIKGLILYTIPAWIPMGKLQRFHLQRHQFQISFYARLNYILIFSNFTYSRDKFHSIRMVQVKDMQNMLKLNIANKSNNFSMYTAQCILGYGMFKPCQNIIPSVKMSQYLAWTWQASGTVSDNFPFFSKSMKDKVEL